MTARPTRATGTVDRPATVGRSTATAARRPTTAERFARRAGTPRRLTRRLAWWLLGVVVTAALAAWVVLASPLLSVGAITVSGVPAAAADGVRSRAAVRLGQPLAQVDTTAVAARALAPDLAAVTVRRQYPRTLVITVVPRVPVLAIRNPQRQVEVLDRYGIVFGIAAEPPPGVPVLDASASPFAPGAVTSVTTVLQNLPAAERARVSHVGVSPSGGVSFRLGKIDVVWGDAGESALKARVLDSVARKANSRIDVSAPLSPAVR